MKKFLGLMLCLLLLAVLPVYAFADTEEHVHTEGIAATCIKGAICATCNQEYTAPNYTVHLHMLSRANCVSGAICADCKNPYSAPDPTVHEHMLSRANCKTGAICADCKNPYSAPDPTVHEHVLSAANCQKGAICADCNNVFTAPDYTVHLHLKSAANCTTGAICADCNKEYTAPDYTVHLHRESAANCITGAICADCHNEYTAPDPTVHLHRQSAANCTTGAICADCKNPYSAPDPTVHLHQLSAATCTSGAICADCNQPYTAPIPHSYGSDGFCPGCGAYSGSVTVSPSVTKVTYKGAAHTPGVTVTAGGKTIAAGNYTVSYAGNINAGTATVTVNGIGGNQFTGSANFIIEPATLTVGVNDITINQNQGQPTPSLYINGLVAGQTASISGTPKFTFHTTSGDQTWLDDPVNFMGKYTIKWTNPEACNITVSGGNTGNYTINKVTTGTLNVIPTKAYFDMAGVKTYATVDGYAVNMHAMSDKNLDKILDNPNKEGTIELKFKPVSCLNYINTVRIPTALVEAIAEAANDAKSDVKALEVTLINGRSIKLDAKALDSIAEEAEGKFVAIVMVKSNDVKTAVDAEPLTKAQKKGLGDRPAYVFSIISGKEILDEDIEGNFVMQIPYKTRYKETEEGLKVYSIDEDGNRTAVETSYNENTEKVVWNADSLGFYVIEHEAAKK